MSADNNPKHAAGRAKASMRHVPPSALLYLGAVMDGGAEKYGPFNWGEAGVTASIYYDAAMRHLFAWFTGEEVDPESGLPHEAHVMACMAILIDARERGVLDDDRPRGGESGRTTPSSHVAQEVASLNQQRREIAARGPGGDPLPFWKNKWSD